MSANGSVWHQAHSLNDSNTKMRRIKKLLEFSCSHENSQPLFKIIYSGGKRKEAETCWRQSNGTWLLKIANLRSIFLAQSLNESFGIFFSISREWKSSCSAAHSVCLVYTKHRSPEQLSKGLWFAPYKASGKERYVRERDLPDVRRILCTQKKNSNKADREGGIESF